MFYTLTMRCLKRNKHNITDCSHLPLSRWMTAEITGIFANCVTYYRISRACDIVLLKIIFRYSLSAFVLFPECFLLLVSLAIEWSTLLRYLLQVSLSDSSAAISCDTDELRGNMKRTSLFSLSFCSLKLRKKSLKKGTNLKKAHIAEDTAYVVLYAASNKYTPI
jgi:hypothetical protein